MKNTFKDLDVVFICGQGSMPKRKTMQLASYKGRQRKIAYNIASTSNAQ